MLTVSPIPEGELVYSWGRTGLPLCRPIEDGEKKFLPNDYTSPGHCRGRAGERVFILIPINFQLF
jgi:hypothetical protein